MSSTIKAAGCVVYRKAPTGKLEFLIIHRPFYDDWTLPKGKQEPGETNRETALRETREETGVKGKLGKKVLDVHYHTPKGNPKVVAYYSMLATSDVAGVPNEEVDDYRWVSLKKAFKLLSFTNDRNVLEVFISQWASYSASDGNVSNNGL